MNEKSVKRRRIQVDDQGRMISIPTTLEEREARAEEIRLMFEALEATPDDPSEPSWGEIFRAIDSHRPDRPLFEGLY